MSVGRGVYMRFSVVLIPPDSGVSVNLVLSYLFEGVVPKAVRCVWRRGGSR